MKKLLIASTALVATASVAAAEVNFGGYGRFGILYVENDDPGLDETRLESRFRLNVNTITESDGGVRFGARIRFQADDQSNGQGGVADNSAAEFNVEAGGLRLDVGNTSDVIDSGDVLDYFGPSAGLTDFGEISSNFGLPASGFGTSGSNDGSLGSVDPTIKARFSTGGLTVAASYQANALSDGGADDVEEWQVGAGYQVTDGIKVGAAFGNVDDGAGDDADFWALGADGSFGAIDWAVLIADIDTDEFDTGFGGAISYNISSATSIRFVVSDNGSNIEGEDETAYAVGFQHSLGGGVSLRGGVGVDNTDSTIADLGVRFNF
ncbi:MAG: porin [Pseudomonadota bacterium]